MDDRNLLSNNDVLSLMYTHKGSSNKYTCSVRFFSCDNIPKITNLRDEMLILAYGLRESIRQSLSLLILGM